MLSKAALLRATRSDGVSRCRVVRWTRGRLGRVRNVTKGWSVDDVPRGPYLHGSRRLYQPDDFLPTDVISNIEGEEDDRQVCFATTCLKDALDWAYRRGIRHGGDMLYVYEVEMVDPQVDVNMHPPGSSEPVRSVMSSRGRVSRLVHEVAVADYPDAFFG